MCASLDFKKLQQYGFILNFNNTIVRISIILLTILFSIISNDITAQSRTGNRDDDYDRGATYEIKTTRKKADKNKDAKRIYKSYDKKIADYEQKMEANAKRYKQLSKDMKKPQYADPTYFGHKRPPKKRPPGKKKFCKKCQMWH